MTRALCSSRKAPFLTYFFFPSDKLVSVDKGEVVKAQSEERKPRRVFVLRGTLFDTGGLRLQTRQHDSPETQDQTERFAFRVLVLLRTNCM